MLSPSPVTPITTKHDFEELVETAGRLHARERNTKQYALDLGVTEELLDRYVDGEIDEHERHSIQSVLCCCRWAMRYVTTMVKARRGTED